MSKTASSSKSSSFVPPKTDKLHPEVTTPLKRDDSNIQYGGVSSSPFPELDTKNETTISKLNQESFSISIEPTVFSFIFAYIMNLSCLSNLMMDKGCINPFNYSSEVCGNLSGNPNEKKNVEILATDFMMYSNSLSLIGAFSIMFIAPWSDKYGRKLPLTLVILGAIFSDLGYILCIINFKSSLVYLLLARIPTEVFGGFICVLMIFFSHASEVSSERNRTLKYTSVEIAFGLGIALGGLTGGLMYEYCGYFYVYVTITSLHIFSLIWTVLVVPETTGLEVNMKWIEKAKDFFLCENFINGIRTTFRAREGNKRVLIQLLLLSMCIIVLTYESFNSIGFIYVHHIYNWDPMNYNIVTTTAMLVQMSATLIIAPTLIRVFDVKDFTLGIMGAISILMKNFILAFSKYHTYIYYAGQLAGFFGQLSTVSIRTSISKIVDKEELGRVFSFLATCEAIIPLLANIAVTKVFEVTIDIYPNVTYGMTVLLLLIPLVTFIWAFRSSRRGYSAIMNTATDDHMKEKA